MRWHLELPNRIAQSPIIFIRQNDNQPGRRRREKEVDKLTHGELSVIEAIVTKTFDRHGHGMG